jgi:gas vesicle protein
VKAFVSNLKERLLNAGNSLLTTIISAIIGPVVETIKKAWIFIKQGYKSVKDAIVFLKDPQNKSMPFSLKLMNVGRIVIAGLSAGGAILLGEFFGKSLMTIPIFNIEIPALGSLANIFGIFLGALVSGIIGAIALNLINKAIANKLKALNKEQQFDKKNQILALQNKAIAVAGNKFEQAKENFVSNTRQRHEEAENVIRQSLQNTIDNVKSSISASSVDNKKKFDKLFDDLDNL